MPVADSKRQQFNQELISTFRLYILTIKNKLYIHHTVEYLRLITRFQFGSPLHTCNVLYVVNYFWPFVSTFYCVLFYDYSLTFDLVNVGQGGAFLVEVWT